MRALFNAGRILLSIIWPFFLLTLAIAIVANSLWFYESEFKKLDVISRTGLEEEELKEVASEFINYFKSDEENLELTVIRDGEPVELLTEREILHMKDVKALIRLDYSVLLGSSIYLIGFGLFCFFQQRRRELAMSFVWGSVLTIAIIIFLGLAVATSFDWFFLNLHLISFSNDLWLLSPQDYLIRLFPETFFRDASLLVTVIIAGLAVLAGVLGALYSSRHPRDILSLQM
jgi:integral membrane protein (TIGR01906 family)